MTVCAVDWGYQRLEAKALCLGLLFDVEDLLAIVVSAGFADTVREAGCSAGRASGDLGGFQAVVGFAGAGGTLALVTLLNWHSDSP